MKYQQWNTRAPVEESRRALEAAGIPSLCALVLCARGVDTAEGAAAFLSSGPELFHDPFLLTDMDKAAGRMEKAVAEGETIAVYGDYDVDGITATALLTQFLREKGGHVISYIPDRIEEGYGLNRNAIRHLRERGVTLIVTVDCGVTGAEEVAYANELGMDVVVTDHHHCKAELPPAQAVVDAKRPGCPYPFPELAGVGIALKTALALTPNPERAAVLERYGDLAALGTVADVVPLTGENRAIVTLGLKLLEQTRRPGLRALLAEAAGQKPINSTTISFTLAPRINAAGRMEKAGDALELLLTENPRRGLELARELCELNCQRQAAELSIYENCVARIEADPSLCRPAIVLADEGWRQGVIGIVASRLTEKYACPAILISLNHGVGKGSCRSYGGFHLFAALTRCAPLLDQFGGHAQAAGLTIREENIPAFRDSFLTQVAEYCGGRPMTAALDVDAELADPCLLTEDQVEALEMLEPFGAGNPGPVFLLRGAEVAGCSDVGGGRHLKLKLRRDGLLFDSIFFKASAAEAGVTPGQRVDVVFTPQIHEYRGRREVQLQLCDLRPAPARGKRAGDPLERLLSDLAITPGEAAALLPDREDFVHLWRWLRRACAGGAATGSREELVACATRRAPPARRSFPRTMVCFRAMEERGLVHVEHGERWDRVTLCQRGEKVDLEQAELMRRLRGYLGERQEILSK